MQIVKRLNTNGGGRHVPVGLMLHVVAEFVDDGKSIMWAPDFETAHGLSYHCYVTPSGVWLQQREFETIAYHAKDNNTGNIGIGIMLPGVHDYASLCEATKAPWVNGAQMKSLVAGCRRLCLTYYIKTIKQHSDVDPGRRWFDPGAGFPFDNFCQAVLA